MDKKINYEEIQHPRISRKKSYFDLIQRVKVNQSILQPEKRRHPVVQQTVGSIKIADLNHKKSQGLKYRNNAGIDFQKLKEFPWSLYNAEPTQLSEIQDDWLLKKINEANCVDQVTKKLSTSFLGRILKKAKILEEENDEIKFSVELKEHGEKVEFIPEEEFKKLNESYVKNGVARADQLNVSKKESTKKHVFIREPTFYEDSSATQFSIVSGSSADLAHHKSSSSLSSILGFSRDSEESFEIFHKIPRSRSFSNVRVSDSNERFKIDDQPSEFSFKKELINVDKFKYSK